MDYASICFEEAVACYGIERVSLSADSNYFYIYISFPEFFIKNSNNKQHYITDMYVRVRMYLNNGKFAGLAGTRTIVTPEERTCSYLQSHIHASTGLGFFDEFCTGDSIITKMKSELASGFNRDKFSMFIFSLEQMVAWESKEGTPYISFESISNRNTAPSSIGVPDLDAITKKLCREYPFPYDIKYIKQDTEINISISTDVIEEKLTQMLKGRNEYFVEKVNGQYYRLGGSDSSNHVEELGYTDWKFNGKHLPLKVRSLNQTLENAPRVIHPYLTRITHEKISKEFKKFLEEKA